LCAAPADRICAAKPENLGILRDLSFSGKNTRLDISLFLVILLIDYENWVA
jgi:hypothetical protein